MRASRRKLGLAVTLATALVVALSACGTNDGKNNGSGDANATYPNEYLLVDAAWSNEHINDDNLVVIDARSKGYEEGHLPGAVHLGSGQVNDPENEISGFLLGEEDFTTVISEIGVNQDSTVLIYDDGNALSATRIFYALELYGLKDQVKVLNGGYPAWLTAGYEESFDEPQITAGNFVAKLDSNLVSSKEDVIANLEKDNVVIVDTRSDGEYDGSDVRAEKGGHIPGAVHQEWSTAIVKDANGLDTFMPYEDLKEHFAEVGVDPDKTVVPYCQTNVRGAHTYFALRLLGFNDVRPYEGSWAEWGNSDNTPIQS